MGTQVMILLNVEDEHADQVAACLASREDVLFSAMKMILREAVRGYALADAIEWDTLLLTEDGN